MDKICMLEETLKSAQGSDRILHLQNLAFLMHAENRPRMLELLNEALALAKQYGKIREEGKTYQLFSIYWGMSGDYLQSLRFAERALKIAEEMQDEKALPGMYNNLSIIHSRLGDIESSIDSVRSAIEAADRSGNAVEKIKGLHNLAMSLKSGGDIEGAYRNYCESARMTEELGNTDLLAKILINTAEAAELLELNKETVEHARHALEVSRLIEDQNIEANAMGILARMQGGEDLACEAEKLLKSALEKACDQGNAESELIFLRNLVDLKEHQAQYKDALEYLHRFNKLKDIVLDESRNRNLVRLHAEIELQEKEREKEKYRLQTIELQLAKDAAEASDNAKGEFLAIVSHEMRTPMNVIMGMLELMENTDPSEQQTGFLREAQISTVSLLGIINDILDFSRIEAGIMQYEVSSFSLSTLLKDTVAEFKQEAETRGLHLIIHNDPNTPDMLAGDFSRLAQVLHNLISNALKFTSLGGAEIESKLISVQDKVVIVKFSVKDTGIGIDPERIDTLFKPFHQIDTSMTRKYGGVGLGLAIANRLVTGMGGQIEVLSAPGAGSTFTFQISLLISEEVNSEAAVVPEKPGTTLKNARILVVEDQDSIREIVKYFLTAEGSILGFATNGKEALSLAKDREFDLILMDIQMPVMDGLTASVKLREKGISIPIIATTGHVMTGHHEMYSKAGIDDCLAKPFSRDMLIEAIAKWLPEK